MKRKSHKLLRNLTAGNLKSQAALEFLTTYGWAFLVILIMIGALAYFGILNPSSLLPERCNFGSEIECNDFLLDSTADNLNIKLINNVGEVIAIQSGDFVISSEGAASLTCTGATLPASWNPGEPHEFESTCTNWGAAGFVPGQKGKVLITLSYNTLKSGAAYPHQVKGEIFATVQ